MKRATELEVNTATTSGAMTIGGVEALAAEVGIKPDTVRAAVDALHPPTGAPVASHEPPVRTNLWIGGPTRVAIERIVDGEVPESEYAVMVDETWRTLQNDLASNRYLRREVADRLAALARELTPARPELRPPSGA